METTIEKELPFQAEAGVFGSDDFLANIGNENLLFLFTFLFIWFYYDFILFPTNARVENWL